VKAGYTRVESCFCTL